MKYSTTRGLYPTNLLHKSIQLGHPYIQKTTTFWSVFTHSHYEYEQKMTALSRVYNFINTQKTKFVYFDITVGYNCFVEVRYFDEVHTYRQKNAACAKKLFSK